jgi:hypothetical protein
MKPASLAFGVLFVAISLAAQTLTDFSGHWHQETNSGTQRHLEVEENGQTLRVKTVATNSKGTRSLEVKYEIGGTETSYTGLDGDQFRSSVHRDGSALIFEIVEHEAGSDIPQKTVWTLSGDGKTLQVDKVMTKSGQTSHSVTTYVRD